MSKDRSYADDEVRAIIERALQTSPERALSHDDLLAVGAGVGLPREAMERAAAEVREARLSADAMASVVRGRRRGVAIHALLFLVLNAFLFAINFLTTPGEWWVLFSVFGWGLGLVLHAGFALFSGVSPRRLLRERRRREPLAASASPPRPSELRGPVRVEAPLDSPAIEADSEPRLGAASDERARDQRK